MSIAVTCQQCRQSFAAQPRLYGTTVRCPNCQAPLAIPHPPAPAAQSPAAQSLPSFAPAPGSSTLPAGSPGGFQKKKKSRKKKQQQTIIIAAAVVGGGVLLVCGGLVAVVAMLSSSGGYSEYDNLLDARDGFSTALTRHESAGYPATPPPPELFALEYFSSPAGELAAYVSPPPGDGAKHPAIIWIFGGFDNSIAEAAWEPATPDNDQSARAFREAGLVMMYPSLRGGNTNPGSIEAFYGEVDDVLAAAEHLAKKDYVDPRRIYLGGHSTGGTLVMLAAASSDRFRAVFSFGPADNVWGYGPEVLPFNIFSRKEVGLRSPINFLHAMQGPVFVFEGTDGNIGSLHSMRRASDNAELHFYEARRASHFSILAPVTRLVAEKVVKDSGPSCNIQFSEEEINRLF